MNVPKVTELIQVAQDSNAALFDPHPPQHLSYSPSLELGLDITFPDSLMDSEAPGGRCQSRVGLDLWGFIDQGMS